MSPQDTTLLQEWTAHGDANAFKEIVSRHAGMVYGTCRRIVGNSTDAEDVAQECFLKLAQGDVRIRSTLVGWLHTVATNGALQHLRSHGRSRRREQEFSDALPSKTEASWDDLQEMVDEAVAALPEDLRYPVICHFHENQSHVTIAKSLGITRSAVSRRVAKGVEQIRKQLRRKGIPVSGAGLSALLSANMAEAAPATLTAALGNVALAGPTGTVTMGTAAAMGATTAIGIISLKKLLAGFVIVAITMAGLWAAWNKSQPERSVPSTVAARQPAKISDRPTVRETDVQAEAEPTTSSDDIESDTPASDDALTAITVTGRVYETPSGKVLPPLVVRFLELDNEGKMLQSKPTDERGMYTITGVRPGRYRMSLAEVLSNGGTRLSGNWQIDREIEIAEGESLQTIDIPFSKGAYISGRVVDTNGDPVEEARIRVATAKVHGRRSWSGRDGHFEVHGLEPSGRAWVQAETAEASSALQGPTVLKEAGLHGLVLVLNQERSGAIEGRVVGVGPGELSIKVYAIPSPNPIGGITDGHLSAGGRFSISSLAAGDYEIGIVDESSMMHAHEEIINVVSGQVTRGIELFNDIGKSVTGTVTDSQRRPVAGADVRAVSRGTLRIATSASDGSFLLTRLPEGNYRVQAAHKEHSFIALEDIPAGQEHVELVMPDRSIIEGRVIRADTRAPMKAYQIEMEPEDVRNDDIDRLNHTTLDVRDDDGRFRLASVRTGDVHLRVYAEGFATTDHIVEIEYAAETVRDVVISLDLPASVTGVVRNTQGAPITSAYISLKKPPDPLDRALADAISADDGTFIVEGLELEEQTLYVTHPEYARAAVPIDPSRNRHDPIAVTLQPGMEVRGAVTVDGAPPVNEYTYPGQLGYVQITTLENPAGYTWTTKLQPDGTFRIGEVSPGLKRIHMSAHLNGHTGGMRDLFFTTELKPDDANDLDIDFLAGNSALEGHIDESCPADRYFLSLVFTRDDVTESFTATPHEDGSFRFDYLPEGEAELQVYERGGGAPWKNISVVMLPGAVTRQDIQCREMAE